jgi:hypothetical protein
VIEDTVLETFDKTSAASSAPDLGRFFKTSSKAY